MNDVTNDSERKSFEAEILQHRVGADLTRKPDGSYSNYYLECMWQGTQMSVSQDRLSEVRELAVLREYRLSAIAYNNSHGVETGTLEEAVEIERKAEERLEAAEKACWEFYRLNPATDQPSSDGQTDGLEVWAVPVLDGEKKTTFYTEQLPFVPGRGVKQLGEPVRMVETKHVGDDGPRAAFIDAAKPYYSEFEWDWGQNRFYDDHVQRAWRLWQAGYYAITTKEL